MVRDATHWDEVVTALGYEHLRRPALPHTGLTWVARAGARAAQDRWARIAHDDAALSAPGRSRDHGGWRVLDSVPARAPVPERAAPTGSSARWTTSAIAGPLLALGLVAAVGVRGAFLLPVIPGLLAAVAIVHAIRRARLPRPSERKELRFRVRPVLRGRLGRMLVGFAAFEVGNVAATLLILRATDLLAEGQGLQVATQTAIALYVAYNVAATLASFPAGGLSDRLGPRGPLLVTALGSPPPPARPRPSCSSRSCWPASASAAPRPPSTPPSPPAPTELRGSAFGLLATVQAIGNAAASTVAGLLYTFASPRVAFGYLVIRMVVALALIGRAVVSPGPVHRATSRW